MKNIKGIITKEDLKVYTPLVDMGNGDLFWEGTKVTLGYDLIPETFPIFSPEHQLEGGMIISKTTPGEGRYQGIIPKGERILVADDFSWVASEKVQHLTDKKGKEDTDFSWMTSELEVLEEDGKRSKNLENARGICLEGNLVMGLKEIENPSPVNIPYSLAKDESEASKDFREIPNLVEGTYIPTFGEMRTALENLREINLVRMKLGLEVIPEGVLFVTRTFYNDSEVWLIGRKDGKYIYEKSKKAWEYSMIPFIKI